MLLSGIKPTGNLHIGNYLGAVKNWVALQNSGKYQMHLFLADLHALTGKQSAEELREQTRITYAELVACGIDPKKTVLFVQSQVPQCTELAWIFSCVTPVAELERMTQYKDQAIAQKRSVNGGLLFYPVLQAADILLYHGAVVPVGLDQIQHVELTRDVARFFNNRYGEYFSQAKPLLTEIPKVMSLIEPMKKMSKSLGAGHVIDLADEPDMITKKLKKAVTATEGGEHAPGVENLLLLLKEFGDAATHKKFVSAEKDGTIQYGDLKNAVGEAIATSFAEFRSRREELLGSKEDLESLMAEGADKARVVAEKTMQDVRKLVGIR